MTLKLVLTHFLWVVAAFISITSFSILQWRSCIVAVYVDASALSIDIILVVCYNGDIQQLVLIFLLDRSMRMRYLMLVLHTLFHGLQGLVLCQCHVFLLVE